MTTFNVSNLDWDLNVSTGNFIAKTGENTRLVRMRAGGNEYMYNAEFWGDYSSGYPIDGGWHSSIASAVKSTEKTIAKARAETESEEPNLPDDENVYAYFPTGAKTPRHKKNFEKIFRDWARAVRTGGDPTEMSHRLTDANPGNPTGEDHAPFAFQIQVMFDPQTRQRIINAVKKGAFVRFHIRSPSGKKMWLEV